MDMDESDIPIEEGTELDTDVVAIFGKKIALALVSSDWKFREMALKIVYKQNDKFMNSETSLNAADFVKSVTAAIDLSLSSKVIKVFNISL